MKLEEKVVVLWCLHSKKVVMFLLYLALFFYFFTTKCTFNFYFILLLRNNFYHIIYTLKPKFIKKNIGQIPPDPPGERCPLYLQFCRVEWQWITFAAGTSGTGVTLKLRKSAAQFPAQIPMVSTVSRYYSWLAATVLNCYWIN